MRSQLLLAAIVALGMLAPWYHFAKVRGLLAYAPIYAALAFGVWRLASPKPNQAFLGINSVLYTQQAQAAAN